MIVTTANRSFARRIEQLPKSKMDRGHNMQMGVNEVSELVSFVYFLDAFL